VVGKVSLSSCSLLFFILSGCRNVTPVGSVDGQGQLFAVRTAVDTVKWQSYPTHHGLDVGVRFDNYGSKPLLKHWCQANLQKLIDDQWTQVQVTVCQNVSSEFSSIAQGESKTDIVRFVKFPVPNHPQGDPRLTEGVYRIVFVLGYIANGSFSLVEPESSRATPPFVVRGP
jgi:hypothetical protein